MNRPDPTMTTKNLIDDLNERFALGPAARFEPGRGGLPRLIISTPDAEAQICLLGAHVIHFQPHGEEPVLFLSRRSLFEMERPIRGGVPVCFPWFAARADDPAAPSHGFARTQLWDVESLTQTSAGEVQVTMCLAANKDTSRFWPHEFELRHRVSVGSTLTMSLETQNIGTSPWHYEQALHSYFSIGDIHRIRIHGLENTSFLDKVDQFTIKQQGSSPLTISSETDRVYLNTPSTCVIEDPRMRRQIRIEKQESMVTVVWNPWADKAQAMDDFANDEWPRMVCVETAAVADHKVELSPSEAHTITARISVETRL